MSKFKVVAVLCDVYEMSKSKSITHKSLDGEPIFVDRIFGLADTMKRNANYKDKRRWIAIKWEETAKLQLEAGNFDWIEYVLEEKRLECKKLKRAIGFPVKDSYIEALEDGEELKRYNDYISVVEDEIEIISGIEFKPLEITKELDSDTEFGDMDSLKAIIKEEDLNIRILKDDDYEKILSKIGLARAKK
jgi:hypothetical protein